MELPHIGDQCSEKSCGQLDFLPVKCDGCKAKFCSQHWTYDGHNCPQPRLKDVQVPVCPLCDKPVANKPGANPDEAVSAHLDRDCKAEGKYKRKPRCTKERCKTRELIKIDCNVCLKNFCLKHRHPQDHECSGKPEVRSAAAQAAINRQQQRNQRPNVSSVASGISKYFTSKTSTPSQPPSRPTAAASAASIQGGLSEDEALARALQESLNGPSNPQGVRPTSKEQQEEQDRMLALALAQGQGTSTTATTTQASGSSEGGKSCQIS
jgi:predicted nucleic acid binding AN1-type Zn finger protein